MELTPTSLNFLTQQFSLDYQRGYKARTTIWQRIADRVPSNTLMNTYAWMAEISGFRQWIGPRVMKNIATRAYSLTNKDWENSFAVSRNSIEDDQFGLYSRTSQLLGDSAARLWDTLVIDALKAGDTTLGPDGQLFFDTDHPVNMDDGTAGTYSNSVTGKPLTVDNLIELIAQMQAYKGESGDSLEITPQVLLVPPQLAGLAYAAAKAASYVQAVRNVAGTEVVAAAGASNPLEGLLDVVVSPRLGDEPTVYYLLSTDRMKPLILQVRKEPQFVSRTEPTMDNVFHRKEFEYGADARGVAGYTLPFLALRAVTV